MAESTGHCSQGALADSQPWAVMCNRFAVQNLPAAIEKPCIIINTLELLVENQRRLLEEAIK